MHKPTASDIGRAAGVSLATVDRVLNGRPGVRQATIDRVHAAIRDIGYVRDLAAANLARRRQYRFAFVLPTKRGSFLGAIREAIEAVGATALADRTEIEIIQAPPEDPHGLVRTLRGIDGSRIDGLAILADETPQLRDEIARLRRRDVRVVAIISNLPSADLDRFVGIDSVAAGRTAGVLMGRFAAGRTGKVVALANSTLSREAIERRLGFDDVLVKRFANLSVLPTIEVHDDPDFVRSVLSRLLETRDDVVGLYSFGTGHQGMIDSLKARPRALRPITIAHDLTDHLAEALREGVVDAVISQNVNHIARSAIRVLKAKCDDQPIVASQERIPIEIILNENLDLQGGAGTESAPAVSEPGETHMEGRVKAPNGAADEAGLETVPAP